MSTLTSQGRRFGMNFALLAFHFQDAKDEITALIENSDAKTVEKVLNCLSNAFTTEEQIITLKIAFNNKSKKVRIKSANTALDLRNLELNEFLKSEYLKPLRPYFCHLNFKNIGYLC